MDTGQPVALQAIALAGRWQRLARSHVPLAGGACSCMLGDLGSVTVADFEQDLMEFLHARFGAQAGLADCFALAGWDAAGGARLPLLLQAVARHQPPAAGALLATLEASLRSFEDTHSER